MENTFSLKDGVLTLDLDAPTYEKCGLVGKPAPTLGRKHLKSRFCVELDLKQASMKDGKKGFERIKWAFKNVLVDSITWLFLDLEHKDVNSGMFISYHGDRLPSINISSTGPITTQHPQIQHLILNKNHIPNVIPPFIHDAEIIQDPIYTEQLFEWLGLAFLNSSRISTTDTTDRYLCEYRLPDDFELSPGASRREQNLVHLQWRGMAGSVFVRELWLELRKALKTGKDDEEGLWFAIGVLCFEEKEGFTVLCTGGEEVLVWEYD